MNEIILKLIELEELLKTIPEECKGNNNAENRRKYMKVKSAIQKLKEDL